MPLNLWHDLETGSHVPEIVNVVVEIPSGSRNKYELHKQTGAIKLDRVLFSAVRYPGDYGFIPQTYYDDGDPLDVLIMTNNPTFPGCIVEARPIGIFHLVDNGEADDKILAVLHGDPFFADFKDYQELPAHFMREVTHFFTVYKELQGHTTETEGWEGPAKAHERIQYAIDLYWHTRRSNGFRKE